MSTPADPICDRTDLPESMCSHCRGLDGELPGQRSLFIVAPNSWASPARYEGVCQACHGVIEIHDSITPTTDNQWVHTECATT